MQIKILKMLRKVNNLCIFSGAYRRMPQAYHSIPEDATAYHSIPEDAASKRKQTVSRWQALAPPKKNFIIQIKLKIT
jgi:hypothetical protein